MGHVKIAIVGAGSYTFGPSMLTQLYMQPRLNDVHQAVELDPTVLDKPAGIRAIDECLAVHADVLPAYAG